MAKSISEQLYYESIKYTLIRERIKNTYIQIKDGKVFEAGEVKIWKCRNCGHIVVGTSAPEVCPVCNHPKAYFEIKAENY